MAAAAVVFLLPALLASTHGNFYGKSVSFMAPQKNKDGTFEVSIYYRVNGRGTCNNQLPYRCESGVCTDFRSTEAVQTDTDSSGQDRWCQTEGNAIATIPKSSTTFTLSASGCCWPSNVNREANWTAEEKVDLGIRSDTHTFNKCPVTATVASLRVPQNCFSSIPLLAYDPDGDHVRCRFAANSTVGTTLDENECTVKTTGQLGVGVHVFELVLEDYSTKDVNLSYADGTSSVKKAFNVSSGNNSPPFSQISLQFALEILPPLPNCAAGHVQPQFLSQTPSNGNVHHASVGDSFQLHVVAQADHAKIHDFQVSGPLNMTKQFKNDTFGKAEATLSWTPQLGDLRRCVLVCFTAETNESQSEMRCVIVIVTRSSATKGKAVVTCSANQMTVALEKVSMPGIDKNWLKLEDPSCSLTSNDTHIMGTMSFQTCGTKIEDNADFIVFKNEINSFELANTVITRRKRVRIGFSCQFPKTVSISSSYQVHQSNYIFTESSFGTFGYGFEIFIDGNFTTTVAANAYPVEVKLLDTIYMGIQAVSDLKNVTLFVESCKATPDNNPENSLSYDLVRNGCLKDETMNVHPSNSTSFRFEVQAFKFSGNYEQVYITCSVILCETGNPISRCAQGCLKNSARRYRRGFVSETASHYITQGPLKVVRQADPNAAVQRMAMEDNEPFAVSYSAYSSKKTTAEGVEGTMHILSTNLSTVVFVSLFIVMLVVLAGVVGFFARKTKTDDHKTLLVAGWSS
ncbi:uncharacterized protein ACJ7VT_022968 [Polymixia lowei]